MQVQTSNGQVDLTAEMLRAGMVFTYAGGTAVTLHNFIPAHGVWQTSEGWLNVLHEVERGILRFAGCDPEKAARIHCCLYGVHGDAAAHGFARLRGGGAVDLRLATNLVAGMKFRGTEGNGAIVVHEALLASPSWVRIWEESADGWRFVGLEVPVHSGRPLRERFCCDARNAYMDVCCSLAIGDHDTHEDIAAGVKWKAAAARKSTEEKPFEFTATFNGVAFPKPTVYSDRLAGLRHELATSGDLVVPSRASAIDGTPLKFHDGPTTGGTVRIEFGGQVHEVKYERETTSEQLAKSVAAAFGAGYEADNGVVRETGQACPDTCCTSAVAHYSDAEAAEFRDCARCGSALPAEWYRVGYYFHDVTSAHGVDTKAAVCFGCFEGLRPNRGQYVVRDGRIVAKEIAAARPRVTVHPGGAATFSAPFDGLVTLAIDGKVRLWAHRGGRTVEVPPSEYDVVRLPVEKAPPTAADGQRTRPWPLITDFVPSVPIAAPEGCPRCKAGPADRVGCPLCRPRGCEKCTAERYCSPECCKRAAAVLERQGTVAEVASRVPEHCTAAGWRGVVHVLAADLCERMTWENGFEGALSWRARDVAPIVSRYAKARETQPMCWALPWAVGEGGAEVERALRAYEGSR